jgi:hypothetical protein
MQKVQNYSCLNATIGSAFAARRAGIQHASKATTTNSNPLMLKVNGSVGLTSTKSVSIKRASPNDAITPTATPKPPAPSPHF